MALDPPAFVLEALDPQLQLAVRRAQRGPLRVAIDGERGRLLRGDAEIVGAVAQPGDADAADGGRSSPRNSCIFLGRERALGRSRWSRRHTSTMTRQSSAAMRRVSKGDWTRGRRGAGRLRSGARCSGGKATAEETIFRATSCSNIFAYSQVSMVSARKLGRPSRPALRRQPWVEGAGPPWRSGWLRRDPRANRGRRRSAARADAAGLGRGDQGKDGWCVDCRDPGHPTRGEEGGAAVRVSASRSEHVAGKSRSRSATGAPGVRVPVLVEDRRVIRSAGRSAEPTRRALLSRASRVTRPPRHEEDRRSKRSGVRTSAPASTTRSRTLTSGRPGASR